MIIYIEELSKTQRIAIEDFHNKRNIIQVSHLALIPNADNNILNLLQSGFGNHTYYQHTKLPAKYIQTEYGVHCIYENPISKLHEHTFYHGTHNTSDGSMSSSKDSSHATIEALRHHIEKIVPMYN